MPVTSASIFTSRSCTIWNATSGLPNCSRCLQYVSAGVVGGDRVPERAPGARGARGDQDAAGVLERVGSREPARLRDAHVLKRDLGLPDRTRGALASDRLGVVARVVAVDEEAFDLPVGLVARPDHGDVGDRAVADPALGAIDDPPVTVAPGGGLQRNRVRAVVRLGQRERADLLQPGHPRQPALLLLVGPEHVDRLHGQAGLDAKERAEAPVAAVDLHVDESAGQRTHRRAPVALDVLAHDLQLSHPVHERPRQLGFLPVGVDGGQHLVVDEAARRQKALPLLVGERLAHEEVVGGERVAEVLVRHCRGGHAHPSSSGSASASAIAR
jgi:hypothetical protein